MGMDSKQDSREGSNSTYDSDYYDTHEDYNYTYYYEGEKQSEEIYSYDHQENPRDSLNGSKHCFDQHDGAEKEHGMVVIFCDDAFVEIPKCCDKKENLNLR